MAATSEQPRQAPLHLARPLRIPEVQELWYALQAKPWQSLALIPSSADGSVRDLAESLGEVGGALRGATIRVFHAEGSDSSAVVKLMVDIRTLTRAGEMAIVSLDPPVRNPTGISVVRACDAALLAIEMSRSNLSEARHTMEMIGPDRLLGSVLLLP